MQSFSIARNIYCFEDIYGGFKSKDQVSVPVFVNNWDGQDAEEAHAEATWQWLIEPPLMECCGLGV